MSTRLPASFPSDSGSVRQKSVFSGLIFQSQPIEQPLKKRDEVVFPLNCSISNNAKSCPAEYYPSRFPVQDNAFVRPEQPEKCPDYFRWIHEDLSPWRETGISEELVMSAKTTANFRLIILNGKAYVETYQKGFQSRDTFTLWGILQLLRRYPGQLPDLDLMFDCVDWPVVKKDDFYRKMNENVDVSASAPPPLFRYCGDNKTFDIVFPDWSFWGWPEINIKPWDPLLQDLKKGNERTKWVDRDPHAYWKGNPEVAEKRKELIKCNVSDQQDWNARVYNQNWLQEQEQGYQQSDLSRQCNHRFKIYIEGSAWSVSEKYILACDSVTLLVTPLYYDFFTRSLIPLQHYWPVRDEDKCRSIKYAVDWGNSHEQEARAIGNAASRFIQEELRMDYVYDYMFHLLSAYAKLLNYKPNVPPGAVELCSESMACPEQDPMYKKFMMESVVKGPANAAPCEMPPPYGPATLHSVLDRKNTLIKQVQTWEEQFWNSQNKQG